MGGIRADYVWKGVLVAHYRPCFTYFLKVCSSASAANCPNCPSCRQALRTCLTVCTCRLCVQGPVLQQPLHDIAEKFCAAVAKGSVMRACKELSRLEVGPCLAP